MLPTVPRNSRLVRSASALLTVAVSALLYAGCSGSSSATPTPSAATTTANTATTSPIAVETPSAKPANPAKTPDGFTAELDVPFDQSSFVDAKLAAADTATSVTVPEGEVSQVAQAETKPAQPAKVAATPQQKLDPNQTIDQTFDDIKFEMKKEDPFLRKMLTEKIENLNGQKIRIRGYIFPPPFQTGLTDFILVRDNRECCFGPGAALYDCIVIQMAEGKTTDYTIAPVAVEGRFSVEEVIGPDRKHLAIYKLVAEKVE